MKKLAEEWGLKVEEVFRRALPAQTATENSALEQQLVDDGGPRDPLVVWRRAKDDLVLIDGHHRYEICKRHGLPFAVTSLRFESEQDVLDWMLRLQLSRRNMSLFAKIEAAVRLTPLGAKLLDATSSSEVPAERRVKPIAEMTGTTVGTVSKALTILRYAKDNTAVAAKLDDLRSGDTSIYKVYTSVYAMSQLEKGKGVTEHYRIYVTCRKKANADKVVALLRAKEKRWGLEIKAK